MKRRCNNCIINKQEILIWTCVPNQIGMHDTSISSTMLNLWTIFMCYPWSISNMPAVLCEYSWRVNGAPWRRAQLLIIIKTMVYRESGKQKLPLQLLCATPCNSFFLWLDLPSIEFVRLCRPSGTSSVLFSCPCNLKKFAQYLSHQILRHMHGVLNVDERKN
jgi:hypothetical protein